MGKILNYIKNFIDNQKKTLQIESSESKKEKFRKQIHYVSEHQQSLDEKVEILNKWIEKIRYFKKENLENTGFYEKTYSLVTNIIDYSGTKRIPKTSFPKKFTIEEITKISLDFFREIDEEYYLKAKNIIDGKDISTDFITYESQNDNDCAFALYNEESKKAEIRIPIQGNIKDAVNIVHEISHRFDMPENVTEARRILADVNSYCFERMMYEYLKEKKICNDDEISCLESNITRTMLECAEAYKVQYELLRYVDKNGRIEKKDLKQITQMFEMSLDKIYMNLITNDGNMEYTGRYPIAAILSYQFIQNYKKDHLKSLKSLKEYQKAMIKGADASKLQEILGIDLNDEEMVQIAEYIIKGNIYENRFC